MSGEPHADAADGEEDPWALFNDIVVSMSVDEIRRRYKDIGILPRNRNSTVRVSIHNMTGQQVVMKILNKSMFGDPRKRQCLYREIRTLQLLGNQKHVTELYEAIDSGDRIWVVIEFAAGGDLMDMTIAKAPFQESAARDLFRPIVKTVAYMHSIYIVHRDLKLENVFLSRTGKVLLADFGFARFFDPKDGLVNSICGTPHYSPPEIIQGIPHNPIYADSWSLGVLLFMLLFRDRPFKGGSIQDTLQAILRAELKLPSERSESVTDLLHHLVTLRPENRLTPGQIMQHPWINKNRIRRNKKPEDKGWLHKVVLQDMGITREISIDDIDSLSDDDIVSYKIIHRRYQTHDLQLPPQVVHAPVVPPIADIGPQPGARDDRRPSFRKGTGCMGLNSGMVAERLPALDRFLRVSGIRTPMRRARTRLASAEQPDKTDRRRAGRMSTRPAIVVEPQTTLRKEQTLRLRSLNSVGMPVLPRMDCQHQTLEEPIALWKRPLACLAKAQNVSIITEQDFELYMIVGGQNKLHVVLHIGCVHEGCGLIGYKVSKVKGEDSDFTIFERALFEYLGF
jgi:serine/threonine protein kinase